MVARSDTPAGSHHCSPLIPSGPSVKQVGSLTHAVLHVMDITPTLLESAGVEHPARKEASTGAPPQGTSTWPLLAGGQTAIRTDSDWLGWELFGNRAIRQGDRKLLFVSDAGPFAEPER